jgi:hypothetical protein
MNGRPFFVGWVHHEGHEEHEGKKIKLERAQRTKRDKLTHLWATIRCLTLPCDGARSSDSQIPLRLRVFVSFVGNKIKVIVPL